MFKGLEKIVKESAKKGKDKNTGGGKPKKQRGVTSFSGKGKLTTVRMKSCSQYYRNAIVKHAPNVEATRNAIWAIIIYHSWSTADDPHHDH